MAQNPAIVAITAILRAIIDSDNETIQSLLDKFPLGSISLDQAETLISVFLKQAKESNNHEATRIIINTFDLARIQIEILPAMTQLFLNEYLARETIFFVLQCFPEKLPIDYYVDLVNTADDMAGLKVANKMVTFFPNISSEDWGILIKMTDNTEEEEYPNQLLRAFFQVKVAETGTCSSKPSWVRSFPQEKIIPVPDGIPSVKEAVQLLLEDMDKRGIVLKNEEDVVDIQHGNEVKEALISQYAISTISERIQMLSLVREIPPFDDTVLFREFGPINTIYSVVPNIQHECNKHGGCRMLTCNEFEQMYQDGEEIDCMTMDDQIGTINWFRGSCDQCLMRILYKHYAVRQPLPHGGWRGCYCSVKCMTKNVDDPNILVMVGRIQEQLDIIGISDR